MFCRFAKKYSIIALLALATLGIFGQAIAQEVVIHSDKRATVLLKVEKVFGEKAEKGLGGRDGLAPNTGMLFDMNERYEGLDDVQRKNVQNPIWMMGMQFPIDIIWIAKGEVVHVVEGAPIPYKGGISYYAFVGYCDYVLEVQKGFVTMHGIRVGNSVEVKE